MIHVVFDARCITDHYPGIGRYGSGLTRALANLVDLQLTLLVDPRASRTLFSLPDVEIVPAACSPRSLRQQWAVPALLRRVGADVYHSPYYLIPYRAPCPTAVTFYDLIPLVVAGTHSALFRLFYRLAHRLAAAAADRIIAVSQSTATDLERMGVPRDKITVVPLGVSHEFRPRSSQEIQAVRQRYGLPERFALYVGTNKPHKNLPRLVEAWALVCRRSPSPKSRWTLVVAGGEDPRYPRAVDLAAAHGVPVFAVGPMPETDLPALYSAASLFIFPSLYEGFGLPVLEAMACGTPVICSATSSLPEVAGDAALMVEPTDVPALAESIRLAMVEDDLRAELRTKGLARAAEFTWERTASETFGIYISIGAQKQVIA